MTGISGVGAFAQLVIGAISVIMIVVGGRAVLAQQLEFHLRYVPAAAEMLRTETHGCGHARPRSAP